MAVLDPFKIAGTASLPTGTAYLGPIGVYASSSAVGQGWKDNLNATPAGLLPRYWEASSSNAIGQAIVDIVSGTVHLSTSLSSALSYSVATSAAFSATVFSVYQLATSASVTATQASASALSASVTAAAASSAFGPISAAFWPLSATLGTWPSGSGAGQTVTDVLSDTSSTLAGLNSYFNLWAPGVAFPTWGGTTGGLVVISGTDIGVLTFPTSSLTAYVRSGSMSGVLERLANDFYNFSGSDVLSNAQVSGAVVSMSIALRGAGDITSSWSGSFANLGVYQNLRDDYYTLSGAYYTTIAPQWVPVSSTAVSASATATQVSGDFYALSGNLDSSASIWNAGVPIPGMAYLTSSQWNPDGGISYISGDLQVTGAVTASGFLVPSGSNGVFITSLNGATVRVAQSGTSVQLAATQAVNGEPAIEISGVYYNSTIQAVGNGGGASAGLQITTDAANITLNPATAVISNKMMTVSGSLEITGAVATTLYLNSPNGSRWAITIDDSGVLSSTLA